MITSQDYVAGTSAKTLNPANPQVIVIDPILQVRSHKLRTAAYARVSSDSDDQLYLRGAGELLHRADQGKRGMEFVDIYADEGITGLRMDKRMIFCG